MSDVPDPVGRVAEPIARAVSIPVGVNRSVVRGIRGRGTIRAVIEGLLPFLPMRLPRGTPIRFRPRPAPVLPSVMTGGVR